MWKLEYISARNICSFRELEYTPRQGATTLIFGHNLDNESQKSNGSGKSTLIEAVALGITGSPLRKVRSEEVINDSAEECYVSLRFRNTATSEEMTVERKLYRKGTSDIEITINNGKEKVGLAGVDAYNKYILEKLGITREELYGSYILSRHRYQDFLSASDKDKKEIINKFSNGVLVDQAIDEIASDLAPLEMELKGAELNFEGIEGRIEMLTEQIRSEKDSRQEKERTKQDKISAIKETIAEKRALIRDCEAGLKRQELMNGTFEQIDGKLQKIEDSGVSLNDCLADVRELLTPLSECKITDWTEIAAAKNRAIAEARAQIDKWLQSIAGITQKIATAEADLATLQSEHRVFTKEADSKGGDLKSEMQSLADRCAAANAKLSELQRRKRTISGVIESLNAKLAGLVTCPACQHQFLVSDDSFDVEGAKIEQEENRTALEQISDNLLDNELEAEKSEQMMVHVRGEIRNLEGLREQWKDRLAKAERSVQAAEYEMEGARFNLKRIQDAVVAHTKEVEDMRRSLFDEAYEGLGAAKRASERIASGHRERISAANSSIDTLQHTITELETSTPSQVIASLKESLKTYRKRSAEALKQKEALKERVDTLNTQTQLFHQFRTHLANTKIAALSAVLNQVLEELGSTLRVRLSGYTQLKSGAIRDKISVSIHRDGIDIGSFGKCSAGEAARVNLASLLAMQKLVNGNADFGKGLDLLILDEIIDAVDESGLAAIFSALNKLQVTALVVSHGLTSEGYPHKLQIVKENGESRIE